MADSQPASDRTESATPRRRDKARDEGQVPRSQELSGAVVLLAGALGLAMTAGTSMARHAMGGFRTDFQWLGGGTMSLATAAELLQGTVRQTLLALAPFALAVMVPTLLVNLVQARGVASLNPLAPKMSRVNPLEGVKRVFGLQGLVNLLKALAKFAVLGAVTYLALSAGWIKIVSLAGAGVPEILHLVRELALRLALFTGFAFLALSAFDYGFQVYQHEKNLRMTKQEVKQENKETEGDPLVKSRLQTLARAMARKRMLGDVATADVVVTNPTHIAVALKYDPAVAAAPIVLAMGERKLAERIKAIARKAGVPTIENKPLARTLRAMGTVGEMVPPALYTAVAEILAYVYRRRQQLGGGGGSAGEVLS